MSKYFLLESIGIVEKLSKNFLVEEFKKSIKFDGVWYEVELPWKSFLPSLSFNYGLSFGLK